MKLHTTLAALGLAATMLAHAEIRISQPGDLSAAGTAELGTLTGGYGIDPGQPAPDATLRDLQGFEVSLADYWSDQHVLLVFYRGGWCPYCNAQIRELTVAYPGFAERGVLPVLVSVDRPDAAALLDATYDIPFPVLSDSDLNALEAYNVVLALDDASFLRMQGFGIDLEEYSGETHHAIAAASVFLVERGGALVWSHAGENYRIRPSAAQLLDVIDQHLPALGSDSPDR